MVIDKNYFLNRLANGEDMDAIGEEIAAMMTEALAEHAAQVEAQKALAAQAEMEAEKRELIAEMVDIIKELAILEGMDEADMTISDEEMDQLVNAFTEMFAMMREVKKLASALENTEKHNTQKVHIKATKSDDDVLADFIKMFS